MSLAIAFWGTRGSVPTPGPATVRYGGNTPCLTITDDGGHRLVIDAGTGLLGLGRSLVADPAIADDDVTILLSHTHWDHIQALPFFAPLYRAGNRVSILGPAAIRPGPSLDDVLRSQMAPAVFPVPSSALAAAWDVTEIESLELELSGFDVRCLPLCHPGATLGFSVAGRAGARCVSYMTDNELGADLAVARRGEFVRFLRGSDVLIHDAMYFSEQLPHRVGWGHSSAAQAVELALEAGVRTLVLFHHDPSHDDRTLERLLEQAEESRVRHGGELDVTIAAEGSTLRC